MEFSKGVLGLVGNVSTGGVLGKTGTVVEGEAFGGDWGITIVAASLVAMGTGVFDMLSCASKNLGLRIKNNSATNKGILLVIFIVVFLLVCLFFGK